MQTPRSTEGGTTADGHAARIRFWLGFAVVAAIAVGSIAVALVVHERERDSFDRSQQSEATRAARQAEAQAALSVGQLGGAAAFYQAEGRFSRHEFGVVAHSLLHLGPLSATAFIGSVPQAERPRFERAHGFAIRERGALGQLRPAKSRPHYFPLTYARASGLKVGLPLGYDVGSDLLRGAYLLQARDSGRPTATRVMRLSVGGTGINVFWPVYRDGAPTRTVAQRRAALIGFAGGAFELADLAATAEEALPQDADVTLTERGKAVAGGALPVDESASAPIAIANRTWLLIVRDPGRPGVGLPVMIAVVGLALAGMLAALVVIWSRNERMQELARQANHDSLTGLKNRRRFEEDLRTELARSHRYGAPGALLMLDVDRFKRVNDSLGHAAGDRVLADIAATLQARARETDVVARIGGDEFALVLPGCDVAEARDLAGDLAGAIRARPVDDGLPGISASIGIAPFGEGQRLSWETVLARADAAMYAAKEDGRDSVCAFGDARVSEAAPSLGPE